MDSLEIILCGTSFRIIGVVYQPNIEDLRIIHILYILGETVDMMDDDLSPTILLQQLSKHAS